MKGSAAEIVLFATIAIASLALLSLTAADPVHVTQGASAVTTTTLPANSTITSTIVSTRYSTATNIINVTSIQGTKVTTVYSTFTIGSATTGYTAIPTASTTTTTQIAVIEIVGNAWGELLAETVGTAAILTVIGLGFSKILAASRQGLVCGECGYRNPPFNKSYCSACGKALRDNK